MSETVRRWWDFQGNVVELAADVPPTMYDGLNHQIAIYEGGAMGQMFTACGKRACPFPKLREVPGRGPVDCGECIVVEAL